MTKIRAIAVDDEKQAREGLKALLKKDPEVELIACCSNGMEAIASIIKLRPALLFLDIQMPEVNGFEVLNSLPKKNIPPVIFTTAYDQYALKAFEIHAIDYLLKPFTDSRFFQALDYAKEQIRNTTHTQLQKRLLGLLQNYSSLETEPTRLIREDSRDFPVKRLVVKTSGKIHILQLRSILFFEACDYYVKIHTDKQEYMVRESLKALTARLPSDSFVRIHRSTIIHIESVQELQPYTNGDFHVTLRNGIRLKGSRTYREVFKMIGI